MTQLRIPLLLNKGRKGIPFDKLSRIAFELQQFLSLLAEDVEIPRGNGWLATNFYDGSFGCVAEKAEAVENLKAHAFKQAFRNITARKPDARVRPSTLRQYTKITEPMDFAEIVEFRLPSDDDEREEWFELTKKDAEKISSEVHTIVRSHGGVQGIIHSVFFGASPPHFQLRELSTGELIKCIYNNKRQYDELAQALSHQNAVLHVYGTVKTDLVNRQIDELRVDRIEIADSFSKDDLERFIGSAPGILGGQTIQEYIDYVRERVS